MIDVTAIPPGQYPYQFSQSQLKPTDGLAFTVTGGENIYCSDGFLDSSKTSKLQFKFNADPKIVYPVHYIIPDVWGNKLTETDSLGYVTDYEYNRSNKPIKEKKSPVDVVNEDGSVTLNVRPITLQGFNECDVNVGTTDANGNTTAKLLDEAGQDIGTVAGDGTVMRKNVLDALSRVTEFYNASGISDGNKWTQTFNHMNRPTSITSPLGRTTQFTYNEESKQNSVSTPYNTLNNFVTTLYNFDPNLNVSDYWLPGGESAHMEYDRNRQLISKVYSDASQLTWNRDYFGNPIAESQGFGHYDLSGTPYLYDYDFKKQITREHTQYAKHGQYTELSQWENPWSPFHLGGFFYPINVSTPNKDLSFTYAAGRLTQVQDNTLGKTTVMDYDSENRRNYLQMTQQDGTILRTVNNSVDSIGRDIWSYDTQMLMATGYDAVGNRRHVTAEVYVNPNIPPLVSEQWNTFNQANNVVIEGGVLDKQAKQITNKGQGYQYGYANGLRATQMTQDSGGNQTNTAFKYNPDDVLTDTNSSNGDRSHRDYDPAGWMKDYSDLYNSATMSNNTNNWQASITQTNKGQPAVSSSFGFPWNPTGMPNSQSITYTQSDPSNDVTDTLGMGYAGFDEFQLSVVGGTRKDKNGTSNYSAATQNYDPNGGPNSVLNSQQELNSPVQNPALIYYQSAFDGSVLEKQYLAYWRERDMRFIVGGGFYEKAHTRYFYTVNGNYLGSYTTAVELPPSAYVGFRHYFQDVMKGSVEVGMGGNLLEQWLADHTAPGTFNFADVTEPYTGSSSQGLQTYPPPMNSNEVATPGSDFTAISQRNYENAGYAQDIAESSDFSGYEPTYPGRNITLPTLLPNKNNATSFMPLDQAMSKVLGNLYPNLVTPQPPPPKHHHRSFFKELVHVFVEVISVAVGVGVASAFPGIGILVAAAVASAVDAAGQLVEEKTGIESKFSWQEVLDTGISAAFAGWNAGSLGVNTLADVGKIGATKAMLMAGEESVTEQLANLATGFSHKFDLKEVIVSMLSAGANAEIPGDSQLFHTALTSLGSNVATQEWETHHLDIESLAANVLGTTLGQAATNTIEKGAAEFASELKAYVEAQFASMTNGNGQTNVMPAQGGIQGDGTVTPAKAGVQKTNQDVNNSSSADTPSNRYAKLQKQSQDADPSSDPGNDPDANNSSANSNNSNANNSTASGNPSKADRWNQQTKQNGSYSSKQSSQEPAYYEKQDAQWYINQGRLAAYNGQMPDWLKNLSQTDLANFYSGYREGGIEAVTASVESSLLPIGEGIFGALKFGLGFFRGVEALGISTLTKGKIIQYLADIKSVEKEQFLKDLESLGLKFKGQSPDGKFMEYIDKNGNVRVKIHPPDDTTNYEHIHIYDKYSNSLNTNLDIVNSRSLEAHIEVNFNEFNDQLTP